MMLSIINFQFGEFNDSNPNWFAWFSLFINVVIPATSIFFAYWLGEINYKRDKKDKKDNDDKNIQAEKSLFINSLSELKKSLDNQIEFLNEYENKKDFKLKIDPSLQINFLQFINLKSLYHNRTQQETNDLNNLLTSLYSISDFRNSLSSELRGYINKYNIQEIKFKNYRQILYKKFYEYSNSRAEKIVKNEDGTKRWAYNPNDNFMREYSILTTVDINTDDKADRKKIDENFLVPIINISHKYIPEDINAIEINDLANDCHSAFTDMNILDDAHFRAINSHLDILHSLFTDLEGYLRSQ